MAKNIDKRLLEIIFSEQKEELAARRGDKLCHRPEEKLIDLKSPQAQVVIGVRRSGKSTLCYLHLKAQRWGMPTQILTTNDLPTLVQIS